MSGPVPNYRHLQVVFIIFIHSKEKMVEVHRELQNVYEHGALSGSTYRDWFRRFKHSDINVDDGSRNGKQ